MSSNTEPSAWPKKPLPSRKAPLDIDATIELDAWAQIRKGFEPQTPADKWLIDVDENDLMYVYRASTGTCIFSVQFGPHNNGDGMTILEALANRDPEQYRNTKAGYDAKLLIYLIRRLLLKHDVPFPSPSTMPKINQGTHERHVMGNESGINKRPGNSGFVPLNIVHSDNE